MDRRDREAAARSCSSISAPTSCWPSVSRFVVGSSSSHSGTRSSGARERHPALLARATACVPDGRAIRRAHSLQRAVELRRASSASDTDPVAQVLARGQVRLQRRLVTDVGQLRRGRRQVLADVCPRQSSALLRVHEPASSAQQPRLARAVRPGDLQALPAPTAKLHAAQHMAIAAPQVQVLALEAELGHDSV